MMAQMTPGLAPYRKAGLLALVASPAVAIFLSNNAANAGNLLYNILFSRWLGPETFGLLATILTLKLAILAILNALQMAISQEVSRGGKPHLAQAVSRLNRRMIFGLGATALVLLNNGADKHEEGVHYRICSAACRQGGGSASTAHAIFQLE